MTIFRAEFDFAPNHPVLLQSYVSPSELVTSRHVLRFPLIHRDGVHNIVKMLFERTIEGEQFCMTLIGLDNIHQVYANCIAHRTSLQASVSDTFDVTLICEGKLEKEFEAPIGDLGFGTARVLTSHQSILQMTNDNGQKFSGDRITKLSLIADRDMKLVHGQIKGYNNGIQAQQNSLLDVVNGFRGKGKIDFGYKFMDDESFWIAHLDGIKMEVNSRSIKDGMDILYVDFKAERRY